MSRIRQSLIGRRKTAIVVRRFVYPRAKEDISLLATDSHARRYDSGRRGIAVRIGTRE